MRCTCLGHCFCGLQKTIMYSTRYGSLITDSVIQNNDSKMHIWAIKYGHLTLTLSIDYLVDYITRISIKKSKSSVTRAHPKHTYLHYRQTNIHIKKCLTLIWSACILTRCLSLFCSIDFMPRNIT